MTPETAHTKWCPFARCGWADHGSSINRNDNNHDCIADACMAWRWSQEGNGYCGLAPEPREWPT